MDGSRCYGCGGTGLQLTKRGAAARAFYRASLAKKLKDIQVGDQYFTNTGGMGMGPMKWHLITEISQHAPCYVVDGGYDNERVHSVKYARHGKEVASFMGLSMESELMSVRNQEEIDNKIQAALQYMETLGINGKPLKRKTK
jgi:hypothetical protein